MPEFSVPIDGDSRVFMMTDRREPLVLYVAVESQRRRLPEGFRERVWNLVDDELREQGLDSEPDPLIEGREGHEYLRRVGTVSFGEWNNASMRAATEQIINAHAEELASELATMDSQARQELPSYEGGKWVSPKAPREPKRGPAQRVLTEEAAFDAIFSVLRSPEIREMIDSTKARTLAMTMAGELTIKHPTRPPKPAEDSLEPDPVMAIIVSSLRPQFPDSVQRRKIAVKLGTALDQAYQKAMGPRPDFP